MNPRDELIYNLKRNGYTYKVIGRLLNLSKQRVEQRYKHIKELLYWGRDVERCDGCNRSHPSTMVRDGVKLCDDCARKVALARKQKYQML